MEIKGGRSVLLLVVVTSLLVVGAKRAEGHCEISLGLLPIASETASLDIKKIEWNCEGAEDCYLFGNYLPPFPSDLEDSDEARRNWAVNESLEAACPAEGSSFDDSPGTICTEDSCHPLFYPEDPDHPWGEAAEWGGIPSSFIMRRDLAVVDYSDDPQHHDMVGGADFCIRQYHPIHRFTLVGICPDAPGGLMTASVEITAQAPTVDVVSLDDVVSLKVLPDKPVIQGMVLVKNATRLSVEGVDLPGDTGIHREFLGASAEVGCSTDVGCELQVELPLIKDRTVIKFLVEGSLGMSDSEDWVVRLGPPIATFVPDHYYVDSDFVEAAGGSEGPWVVNQDRTEVPGEVKLDWTVERPVQVYKVPEDPAIRLPEELLCAGPQPPDDEPPPTDAPGGGSTSAGGMSGGGTETPGGGMGVPGGAGGVMLPVDWEDYTVPWVKNVTLKNIHTPSPVLSPGADSEETFVTTPLFNIDTFDLGTGSWTDPETNDGVGDDPSCPTTVSSREPDGDSSGELRGSSCSDRGYEDTKKEMIVETYDCAQASFGEVTLPFHPHLIAATSQAELNDQITAYSCKDGDNSHVADVIYTGASKGGRLGGRLLGGPGGAILGAAAAAIYCLFDGCSSADWDLQFYFDYFSLFRMRHISRVEIDCSIRNPHHDNEELIGPLFGLSSGDGVEPFEDGEYPRYLSTRPKLMGTVNAVDNEHEMAWNHRCTLSAYDFFDRRIQIEGRAIQTRHRRSRWGQIRDWIQVTVTGRPLETYLQWSGRGSQDDGTLTHENGSHGCFLED